MGWEFSTAVIKETNFSQKIFSIFLFLIPFATAYFGSLDLLTAGFFSAIMLSIIGVILQYDQLKDPFPILIRVIFGILLVGFFPAHLILIMQMPNGPLLLLFITAITIASDSCAFFTGTFLGRKKLCPSVSPKKTLEGLAGGIIGSGVAGLLVAHLFLFSGNIVKVILFSCFLGFIGTIGDLTESILKRWSGVKDSGSIMPGHGGLLDRFDSLVLAAPTFYYLQHWQLIFP